jgi:hypothetical protein
MASDRCAPMSVLGIVLVSPSRCSCASAYPSCSVPDVPKTSVSVRSTRLEKLWTYVTGVSPKKTWTLASVSPAASTAGEEKVRAFAAQQDPEAVEPVDSHHRQRVPWLRQPPALVLPERQLLLGDREYVADLALRDQLPAETEGVAVPEVLVDRELYTGGLGGRDDGSGIGEVEGQWLLHEDVLPGRGELEYGGRPDVARRTHDGDIPTACVDQLGDGLVRAGDREGVADPVPSFRERVAGGDDLDAVGMVGVAGQMSARDVSRTYQGDLVYGHVPSRAIGGGIGGWDGHPLTPVKVTPSIR